MAYYMVRYSPGANNSYVYPESVAGVVWKSTVYHYSKQVMIGETDADVETDEKQVSSLTSDKAKKLIKEYKSSYPKPTELPDPIRIPRK